MSIERRKDISRGKKYTVFDGMQGLDFDHTSDTREENILINSHPFESGGIDYYVKRKRLILNK